MTTFDELIGAEPDGEERARLRGVHELLLEAGAPPELSPELEAGTTREMTMSRVRAHTRKRRPYVLSLVAAALVAAIIGIGAFTRGHGHQYPSFSLRGTVLAPKASGTLYVISTKTSTPKMKIETTGLAAAKKPYVVYLVRNGRVVAPCGSFTVSSSTHEVTAVVHSPYPIQSSDKWIVTAPGPGNRSGPTVLVPA